MPNECVMGFATMAVRFPAAHQFLRMRLIEETYPINPSISCVLDEVEPGRWKVSLTWPAVGFDAAAVFDTADLRGVYGPWSEWARGQAHAVADLLPV
jgi:hypothetical protein